MNGPTDQTHEPNRMDDGSNDGGHVGVAIFYKTPLGSKTPYFSPNAHFPAKSIASNNFLTIRDEPNISVDCLHKIVVKESNDDIHSDVHRVILMAEIDILTAILPTIGKRSYRRNG